MIESAGVDARERTRASYARCSRIPEFIPGPGIERSRGACRFPPAVGRTLQMRGARQIALIHHLEGPHCAADGGDTGCLNRVTNDHIANWLSRQIIGDWLWTRYGSEQCDRKRS